MGSEQMSLDFKFRTYGSSASYSPPVGGFVEPVDKLTIFAPYLAVFGLVAAVAVVATKPWRREG
jgi:hypothetical protein